MKPAKKKPVPTSKTTDTKREALRMQGVLNPKPDAVRDDLFSGNGFFDRRDLVQVRYEMLRRVRTESRPIAETVTHYGVSRPTYYKLDADFEQEGLLGLLPKKRGPKGGHKLTTAALEAVAAARAEDPSMTLASPQALLHRRFGVVVHPRTIERALARKKKKRI